jgi:hypothetical protein
MTGLLAHVYQKHGADSRMSFDLDQSACNRCPFIFASAATWLIAWQ